MSGSLRDALVGIKAELDKRSEEGEAHLFLNIPFWQLEELLAAHPAAPLLGPRPLLDQSAVADVVYSAVKAQAGPAVASLVGTDVLVRLMELAQPMPTREQIHAAMMALFDEYSEPSVDQNTDAVLALFGGGAK